MTIAPGRYAFAYSGPCFDMICIDTNPILYEMVNRANYTNTTGPLNRYGVIEDPTEIGGMFDTLNHDNVDMGGPTDFSYTPIPAVYFDDSQEFA